MAQPISFCLRAWGPRGRFMSASEKEELQDWIADYDIRSDSCDHGFDSSEVMRFHCDGAATGVMCDAVYRFAMSHPDDSVQLEYSFGDVEGSAGTLLFVGSRVLAAN